MGRYPYFYLHMSDCSLFSDWLPEWFLDRAVADDAFAYAYETCSNAQRGWLKKCVSLHFALQGEAPARQLLQTDHPRLGVRAACLRQPVDWCALVLEHQFVSPVRALAAVLPALLAGVPEVFVLRLAPEAAPVLPWPAGLLVGLELAGVRRMADAPLPEAIDLLQTLLRSGRPGRILELGLAGARPASGRCAALPGAATAARCWLGAAPRIGVRRSPSEPIAASGDTLAEVLAWAHPDAPPDFLSETAPAGQDCAAYDALLVQAHQLEQARQNAALVLGPGMEGCWFWPDLDRDFFLRRTLCCSSDTPMTLLPECE